MGKAQQPTEKYRLDSLPSEGEYVPYLCSIQQSERENSCEWGLHLIFGENTLRGSFPTFNKVTEHPWSVG